MLVRSLISNDFEMVKNPTEFHTFSTEFSNHTICELFSSQVARGCSTESEKNTNSRPGICWIMVTAREMAYISAEKMDAMHGSEAILVLSSE